MTGKDILILLVLIIVGQIVGLIFYFFIPGFDSNLFIPMAVSSAIVWALYLGNKKKRKA